MFAKFAKSKAWEDAVLRTHWAKALFEHLDKTWSSSVTFYMDVYLLGGKSSLSYYDIQPVQPVPQSTNHHYSLTYKEATKVNLENTIINVIKKSDKNDVVIFAFSGHGYKYSDRHEQGICLDDTDMSDTNIRDLFKNFALDTQTSDIYYKSSLLYFFDSCYSGGLVEAMDIYAKKNAYFIGAVPATAESTSGNPLSILGHKFHSSLSIHGITTMAFMEQFWNSDENTCDFSQFDINLESFISVFITHSEQNQYQDDDTPIVGNAPVVIDGDTDEEFYINLS
ncbi:MAG: caspase family protein [Candidatus Heimdallarchaeaceae archaeon]